MDPTATYELMMTSPTISEQADAALNLLVWLAKGGGTVGTIPIHSLVETCEVKLARALDALEEGE
jgi:hypothetical protein